ncbi:MAG: DUF2064 domain-containing protein [Nocardioidaceae bacterium]|nr:DUF2064 domain-containing protein [Nocardioidaceae bacterium]
MNRHRLDRSRCGVLVLAKAPVAGQVKTRLAVDVGARTAADLAAASLLDTLAACARVAPPGHRVVALAGDLEQAARGRAIRAALAGWAVVPQRGEDLGSRLAAAHVDAAELVRAPVVQVGMDTPQLSDTQLHDVISALEHPRCDAVLGPAPDGGWWVLGVASPRWTVGLADVAMSRADTGFRTWEMLRRAGARVRVAATLQDVDTAGDAEEVSHHAVGSRFAAAWECAKRVTA